MCTCFIHWSYHSKRALVSVILVFVQSIILCMTSLSKNKWKISSMFLILLALEFGFRQLILPKMVSHFYCLPVATGCSEFHQILFVFFCLSLDQDNQRVLPKHHFCLYIPFLCNCFYLMDCQCLERFNCEWVVFLARIFVADLHYL